MAYESVVLTKEAGVAIIAMNQPAKMNSLTDQMLDELCNALDDVAKDDEVKVVVLTGSGRAFCAGADLGHPVFQAGSPLEVNKSMLKFHAVPLKIRAIAKPVIASVNGAAVGAGANIALACDMILASDQARFGQVFVNVGVHPDTGGTYFLPKSIGVPKAMELLMTGDIISAVEAERIGMINKVVPVDKLEGATKELVQKLVSGPPIALSMIKTSVYHSLLVDLPTALEREASCQSIVINSEDNKEGVKAFREKRKPLFKGR